MTLLDCRISLVFEKLFIPVLEVQECVLDILYENQHYRFNYPQEVPHIMPLQKPFTREKNQMILTVMIRTGKKYRKIAKGEINFYKKYFISEKLAVDKWVYLALYETQLEQMGHNTNILKAVSNTGKIFLKAQLIDPEIEDQKNGNSLLSSKPKNVFDNISIFTATTHASALTQILKNNLKNLPLLKDKANANKTEKYRSITEHGNEFLRALKNKKNMINEDLYEDIEEEEEKIPVEEFNDGLSDISISIIDGCEENHAEIDKMNLDIDALVNKIKIVYDNKIDDILPNDPVELRKFITTFTGQINNISENYSQNLLTLADINKRIKFQAKDYYERYKENKKTFKKERRDLKNKNKLLEYETKANVEENLLIQNKLEDLKDELNFFKHKVGIKEPKVDKDDDLVLMVDILNSLKNSDIDIAADLDESQKNALNEILLKYSEDAENVPNTNANANVNINAYNNNTTDNIRKLSDTSDQPITDEMVINKIQDIVNDHFSKKNIINMKIDQVDDFVFRFNDKTASFYMEKDVLKVRENGFANFEEWLLANFSVERINTNNEKEKEKEKEKVAIKEKTTTPTNNSTTSGKKSNSSQNAQNYAISPSNGKTQDKKPVEKKSIISAPGSNGITAAVKNKSSVGNAKK